MVGSGPEGGGGKPVIKEDVVESKPLSAELALAAKVAGSIVFVVGGWWLLTRPGYVDRKMTREDVLHSFSAAATADIRNCIELAIEKKFPDLEEEIAGTHETGIVFYNLRKIDKQQKAFLEERSGGLVVIAQSCLKEVSKDGTLSVGVPETRFEENEKRKADR